MDQFLRGNYEMMSNAFLAKKLGVTELALAKRLSRMGLVRRSNRKWGKRKEEFLRENYKRLDVSELAAECNMSPGYIRNKMRELGLA